MIRNMQLRKAFAALLAVLLLTASSWAAACDAACTVKGAMPTCHFAQGSSTAWHRSVQVEHSHCMHMTNLAASKTSPVSVISTTLACNHTSCLQPASFPVSTKISLPRDLHWVAVDTTSILDRGFGPDQFASEAAPPVVIPSLAPVSLALRI